MNNNKCYQAQVLLNIWLFYFSSLSIHIFHACSLDVNCVTDLFFFLIVPIVYLFLAYTVKIPPLSLFVSLYYSSLELFINTCLC